MSQTLPSGIKSFDSSDTVTRQSFNDNWTVIDSHIGSGGATHAVAVAGGAAGFMSGTDKTNLNANTASLAAANPTSITLNAGAGSYTATRKSRLKGIKMQGRTLVNLLGRDGNCDSLSPFTLFGVSPTLSTTQKKYGVNSIKVTNNGAAPSYVYKDYATMSLSTTKSYVLAGWVYIESRTTGILPYIQLCDVGTFNGRYQVTAAAIIGSWQFLYVKVPTGNSLVGTGFRLLAGLGNIGDTVAYMDGLRLYEVSSSDYSAIGTTYATEDAIDKFLPYVDDVKHVNAVYVRNSGKNLLPPFSEWTLHANSVTNEQYKFTHTPTASGEANYVNIPIIGGQTYTLKATLTASVGVAAMFFDWYDASDVYISTSITYGASDVAFNITPPSSATKGRLILQGTQAGTFTFTNPMLNIGSTALTFEQQQPSYMYLPTCNLRSDALGTVQDKMYMDGEGKPRVTRRFRETSIDGSLTYTFGGDGTGYKYVLTSSLGITYKPTDRQAIKYDGKILSYNESTNAADQFAYNSGGSLYIVISDTDSGWGETYTPSVAEIQAYFNGWYMYDGTVSFTSTTPRGSNKYNGSGDVNKRWAYLDSNGQWTGNTTVIPTTQAPVNSYYQQYRVIYQLAQSADEALEYEGELLLHDGANQIAVGTGIVVREAIIPKRNIAQTHLGFNSYPSSSYGDTRLKRFPSAFVTIYRNGTMDEAWTRATGTSDFWQNGVAAFILDGNFDQTASYSVTYLSLDTYSLGIAPLSISAEYASNIKEDLDDVTRALVEVRSDVSVLRNAKAQKQQSQWITPTLLNGWVNFQGGESTVAYMKDEQGFVHLKGAVKSGSFGILLYLPVGYRPSEHKEYITMSNNGTSSLTAFVTVASDGRVILQSGNYTLFSLDGIAPFRAEQ